MEKSYDHPLDISYHKQLKSEKKRLMKRFEDYMNLEEFRDQEEFFLRDDFRRDLRLELDLMYHLKGDGNNKTGEKVQVIESFYERFKGTSRYKRNKVKNVIMEERKPSRGILKPITYREDMSPVEKASLEFINLPDDELAKYLAKMLAYEEVMDHIYWLDKPLHPSINTDNIFNEKEQKQDRSFQIRLFIYLMSGLGVDVRAKKENREEGEVLERPSYNELARLAAELFGTDIENGKEHGNYLSRRMREYDKVWAHSHALEHFTKMEKLLEPFEGYGHFKDIIEKIRLDKKSYQ